MKKVTLLAMVALLAVELGAISLVDFTERSDSESAAAAPSKAVSAPVPNPPATKPVRTVGESPAAIVAPSAPPTTPVPPSVSPVATKQEAKPVASAEAGAKPTRQVPPDFRHEPAARTNASSVAKRPTVAEVSPAVSAAELESIVAEGEKAAPAGRKLPARAARITSDKVVYDRKEGLAVFERNVHVDDEQYQLHADKVFVFMQETNDVKRIVAIGHVAMTNETRRAYGGKASYYRQSGMVVLYSGAGVSAEVRDEAKDGDQTVRGDKIKFWIDREQVEVLNATITAPASGLGAGDLKNAVRENL